MLKDLIGKILKKTKRVVTLSAARTSGGEFLLRKTDFGLVHVEFATVEKLAKRAVSTVKEIHESELAVEKTSSKVTPMKISLTAVLAEGASAPRASQLADKVINEALKESLGAGFYVPVDVKVKQIVQVVPQKRRVR
ncbi:MAG: hypothetical protein II857_09250 [Selenomonadaceae bacterium]|nr:hypothetical protein [Selenomonadaceae bacterium]